MANLPVIQSSPPPAVSNARSTPAKPVRKKRRKLIVGVVVLLVLGAVGWAVANKGKSREKVVNVTTEKAFIKTITQVVSATGKIQPETEVKISPEVAGEIVELPFREGAVVQKGELLARIKPDNYRFQVDQREADLASARASALDSKVRFEKAEADFRRSENIFNKSLVSESEFAAAKATYESARAAYESAQANIRRSEGLLKQAQDQLAKTTLYAPIDGTVSSRTTEVGERVVATGQFSGTEIMRIADLSNMEVRVNINENDIVNVKVGDKARVAIDAFPDRKFDAVVKEIGSAAKITGQNTQDEVTNFLVKIRILDKELPLRPGMSANADVQTKTVENAVAVPIQSVTVRSKEGTKTVEQLAAERSKKADEAKGAGAVAAVNDKQEKQADKNDRESLQRVVFVRNGGTVKMVKVETGVQDTTHIEIKSGLNAGDEVVSGSFGVITRTLKDGMAVTLEKPKDGRK
jgi:HlyD family secretion protein